MFPTVIRLCYIDLKQQNTFGKAPPPPSPPRVCVLSATKSLVLLCPLLSVLSATKCQEICIKAFGPTLLFLARKPAIVSLSCLNSI